MYYVVDCITGVRGEEGTFETLEEAKRVCAEWDAEATKKGHEPGFWVVINEAGEKC